jgi:hypothetical protein
MSHIFNTLSHIMYINKLLIFNTGHIFLIPNYILRLKKIQITISIHYYKHNYKKHFMFLETPTATERSAKGDTLVSSHSIRSHNLTHTRTITCILHPPW